MPEADPVRCRLYPSLPCRVFLVGSFVIDRFGDFSRLVTNGCSVSRTSSAYYYSAKVESGGDSEENSLNCLDREFHKFFMVNASFHHMGYVIGDSTIPASPKTIPHHRMLVLHREFSNLGQGTIGIEKDGMDKRARGTGGTGAHDAELNFKFLGEIHHATIPV